MRFRLSLALFAACILSACGSGPTAITTALAANHPIFGVAGTPASYEALGSLQPKIIATYFSWDGDSPSSFLAQATQLHAIPFITWMPKASDNNKALSIIPEIAEGQYDTYIRSWATTLRAYHNTVFIRFAQEMNGNWSPWNATGPTLYKAAWQRIVRIFRGSGANNVKFIWAPDPKIRSSGSLQAWANEVKEWYPGSHYVNYVGLSVVSFSQDSQFGVLPYFQRLNFLHTLEKKPIIIPEMKIAYGLVRQDLPQWRKFIESKPWIKAIIWSETISLAQEQAPTFSGDMDWSLTQYPYAFSIIKQLIL